MNTAIRDADRLTRAGALASIAGVGDSYDNAMAESVIGLYKLVCVRRDGPFHGVDDLELATLSWVDRFNNHRLPSMIGPPVEDGAVYYRQDPPVQQPPATELGAHHRLH